MNTILNETKELQTYFCPFGSLDIQKACNIGDELWIYENELFEIIDGTRISTGYDDFEYIDPVACVLDHILQMARNHIKAMTGYDFQNDNSLSSTEIYTFCNYLDSQYDYSEEAIENLEEKIKWHIPALLKNKWCKYFLKELELV